MAKKKMTFEDSIRRLDEIVKHLESGDLPTSLISSCSAMLDEAEQKVSILRIGKDGAPSEEPFEEEA